MDNTGGGKAVKKPIVKVFARWLLVASVGLLGYGYVAIGIVWLYAAQTDRVPNALDIDRYARTGQGPWDHVMDLNESVGQGMTAPFLATIPAVLSMIIRPKSTALVLTAICILSGLAIAYTHFWLID